MQHTPTACENDLPTCLRIYVFVFDFDKFCQCVVLSVVVSAALRCLQMRAVHGGHLELRCDPLRLGLWLPAI